MPMPTIVPQDAAISARVLKEGGLRCSISLYLYHSSFKAHPILCILVTKLADLIVESPHTDKAWSTGILLYTTSTPSPPQITLLNSRATQLIADAAPAAELGGVAGVAAVPLAAAAAVLALAPGLGDGSDATSRGAAGEAAGDEVKGLAVGAVVLEFGVRGLGWL